MLTPPMTARHHCSFSLMLLALGACLSGCSQAIPTQPHGVLSTIHQKTLALAAERAVEQAGLTKNQLGTERVSLVMSSIPDSDLGKKHSARVTTDLVRNASGTYVESPDQADRRIDLDVLSAGVDVKNGSLLGFSWLETTAEVSVRAKSLKGNASPEEREGSGTSVFKQVWWLGIGPSEKLK